jgi:hypothetical protein
MKHLAEDNSCERPVFKIKEKLITQKFPHGLIHIMNKKSNKMLRFEPSGMLYCVVGETVLGVSNDRCALTI